MNNLAIADGKNVNVGMPANAARVRFRHRQINVIDYQVPLGLVELTHEFFDPIQRHVITRLAFNFLSFISSPNT
jgi:hypothetical protein